MQHIDDDDGDRQDTMDSQEFFEPSTGGNDYEHMMDDDTTSIPARGGGGGRKKLAVQQGQKQKQEASSSASATKPSAPATATATKPLGEAIERVPRADDGFSVSFEVDDEHNGWRPFLEHYGYCVVRILSKEECEATVDEFFSEVRRRQKAFLPKEKQPGNSPPSSSSLHHHSQWVQKDDPSTWEDHNWPDDNIKKGSFPAISPNAIRNRTHPNLRAFFARIFGTHKILSHVGNCDGWGFMRATRALPFPVKGNAELGEEDYVSYVDRPEWRMNLPPHWDAHPWKYPKQLKGDDATNGGSGGPRLPFYQSLIALVDCDDTVGGFAAAPCSANNLERWAQSVPRQPTADQSGRYCISKDDPWHKAVQHVPLRAGEMVVWDAATLHCNYPNSGDRFRLVQYVTLVTDDAKPYPQISRGHMHRPSNFMPPSNGVDMTLDVAADAAGLTVAQRQMLELVPYE